MPLLNTVVVHPDWSEHHAPTAAGFQTSQVTVGFPTGPPVYDPDTDDTTTTYSNVYTGPAAIQAVNSPIQANVAGQTLAGRSYLVELDFDASSSEDGDLAPGARLHVIDSPNDPLMLGQNLWVVDVQMGSERFSRVLECSDNQADVPSVP